MNRHISRRSGAPVIILMTMNKLFGRISIGFVIFLLLVLVGFVGSVSVCVGLYVSEKRSIADTRSKEQLEDSLASFILKMKSEGFPDFVSNQSLIEQINNLAYLHEGRILICGSDFRVHYDTGFTYTGKYYISNAAMAAIKGKKTKHIDENKHFMELCIPLSEGPGDPSIGVIAIHYSLEPEFKLLSKKVNRYIAYCTASLVLLIVAALFVSIRVSKPIRNLSNAFVHLSDKDPLPVKGYREISEIADRTNQLRLTLSEIDQSRQAFVSNVSHELKTPMASMKVLADSLLSEEDAPVEMYREFLQDINSEIDRENAIISDLLLLVGMDRNNNKLNFKNTHINPLIEIVLNRITPMAAKQSIEVVYENFRDVYADIDENKLIIALTNIFDNAVKYNRPGGYVHVTLNNDISNLYISVEDSGIGIPEESLPHLFERFYRVDKARSRSTGGNGLGLSISYEIIKAHLGEIKVYSRIDEGTTFLIRIPLKNTAKDTTYNA